MEAVAVAWLAVAVLVTQCAAFTGVFVSGRDALLSVTVDAGLSWQTVSVAAAACGDAADAGDGCVLRSAAVKGREGGCAVGEGGAIACCTSAAAAAWTGDPDLRPYANMADKACWQAVDRVRLPGTSGTSLPSLAMVAFFGDTASGVAVGELGAVLWSAGGGAWTEAETVTDLDLAGVATGPGPGEGGGEGEAYAVGSVGTVLRSTDFGATWTLLAPPSTNNLHGCAIVRYGVAVLVGAGASVYRTEDAGATWAAVSTPLSASGEHLLAVSAVGSFVLAVGASDRYLISTDAGASWRTVSGPLPASTAYAFRARLHSSGLVGAVTTTTGLVLAGATAGGGPGVALDQADALALDTSDTAPADPLDGELLPAPALVTTSLAESSLYVGPSEEPGSFTIEVLNSGTAPLLVTNVTTTDSRVAFWGGPLGEPLLAGGAARAFIMSVDSASFLVGTFEFDVVLTWLGPVTSTTAPCRLVATFRPPDPPKSVLERYWYLFASGALLVVGGVSCFARRHLLRRRKRHRLRLLKAQHMAKARGLDEESEDSAHGSDYDSGADSLMLSDHDAEEEEDGYGLDGGGGGDASEASFRGGSPRRRHARGAAAGDRYRVGGEEDDG